jgi:hypothetical protein
LQLIARNIDCQNTWFRLSEWLRVANQICSLEQRRIFHFSGSELRFVLGWLGDMVDDSGCIKEVESLDEHHNYHAVVAACSALPARLVQSDDDSKKVAEEENRYIV